MDVRHCAIPNAIAYTRVLGLNVMPHRETSVYMCVCASKCVYRLLAHSLALVCSLFLFSNSSLPVRVCVCVCLCGSAGCRCCSTLDCKSHANAALRMLADNLNSIGNLRMYIIEIAYVFSAMYKYDVRGGVDFIWRRPRKFFRIHSQSSFGFIRCFYFYFCAAAAAVAAAASSCCSSSSSSTSSLRLISYCSHLNYCWFLFVAAADAAAR